MPVARQIRLTKPSFISTPDRAARPSNMLQLLKLPDDVSGRFYIVKIDGDVAATTYRLDGEGTEELERWGVSGERKAFQGREEFSSLKEALEFINYHHRADSR